MNEAKTRPERVRAWLRAAWQPLVVGLAWIAMTLGALSYVQRHAARMPLADDLELVPFIHPDFHWTLAEMWSQHNEHRLPLPRVLEIALYGATRDIRSLMYVEVALLALLALGALLVVRRMRGRTALVDAVFPLLWLHTGNCENLLMGFQLALVLPTVFACTILLVAVVRPRSGFTALESVVLGTCLVALPLCGGPGLVQVPVLFVGLAVAVWASWRQPDRALKRGAVVMSVFLALVAALCVLYLVDFQYPAHEERSHDLLRIADAALRTTTLVLGIAGERWWPWSGVGVVLFLAITLVLLCRSWFRDTPDRFRVAAIVFALGANTSLALSIGYGRAGGDAGAGFAVRYVPLVSPLVVAVMCAWTLYGGRIGRWLVPGALALVLLGANVLVNAPEGEGYGLARQRMADELDADIETGLEPGRFVDKWRKRIYAHPMRLYMILNVLAEMRLAPFDRAAPEVREHYMSTVFNLPPVRIESPRPPVRRFVAGDWPVLLVPYGCALHFDVPDGTTRLTGIFGILDEVVLRGRTHGLRARVSTAPADGMPGRVLLDRTIDPVRVPADRGAHAIDVLLPEAERHVVLEILALDEAAGQPEWGYWTDLRFQ